MVYVPMAQVTDGITALAGRVGSLAWAARTRSEPHAFRSVMEQHIQQATGGLPVARILSMDEIRSRSTARAGFNTSLLTTFGCAALLLAAIGIYGLMAYSVEQRTQEIGVRLALGARPSDVRNLVVLQGMRLTGIGVAIGLAASLGLTQLIASFLFGVGTWDPLVFLAVPLFLIAVALAATWLPAQRAIRINPVTALRSE
jgi:ABC-type antimicrobial peptide transport system permease subunit